MRMPTAPCNGIDLYYEVHGEGDPLLCVMGLAADAREWVFNVPVFSERHRTVVFDNRDVGRSAYVEEPYEIADMAADALALANHLELERFHLIGVSMGGTIAQEIALAAPERIATLTLSVSWAGGGRWWRRRHRQLWDLVPRLSREELIDWLLVLNLSEQLWEDEATIGRARERLLGDPHAQRPDGLRRQAEASARHDVRDRLGTLSMPVHVIAAERDILVPVWKSRELAELIPEAKLTVVPEAAHGMNVERAQEFNELVLGFVAEVGARERSGS
jgi:3-oxoadipate enol-lactonase